MSPNSGNHTANKETLTRFLQDGSYRPNPVRRVEIPKDNGKMRLLGIPMVVDRLVQQAINQVLTPIYEKQFSHWSFGFRPGKGKWIGAKVGLMAAEPAGKKVRGWVDADWFHISK